jgi:hypothetical protein
MSLVDEGNVSEIADLTEPEDQGPTPEESGEPTPAGESADLDPEQTSESTEEEIDDLVIDGQTPVEGDKEVEDSKLVKHLRKQLKVANKDKRKLSSEVQDLKAQAQPEELKLGEKPTMASCDHDEEVFEKELLAYQVRERQIKKTADADKSVAQQQQQDWDGRMKVYDEQRAALNIPNLAEYEEQVDTILSTTQKQIIIHTAKNAAKVLAVLGKNPDLAAEIAGEKDNLRFTHAVGELETKVKMAKIKRTPIPPEGTVKGSMTTPGGSTVNTKLAKLEAEADRTGDRTKVIRYKTELAKKNRDG